MLSYSRRDALKSLACGFGSLAFAGLAHEQARADANPLATKPTHFPAKAKRIVFIFMQGGPSHVDSFDHKPCLTRENGAMRTFDDAHTFLRNLLTHFDSEFDVTGPEVRSKKELEIVVRNGRASPFLVAIEIDSGDSAEPAPHN